MQTEHQTNMEACEENTLVKIFQNFNSLLVTDPCFKIIQMYITQKCSISMLKVRKNVSTIDTVIGFV